MFRFVSDHTGGIGAKRKQGPRPCAPCKKRHKRCPHTDSADSVIRSEPSLSPVRPSGEQGSPEVATYSPTGSGPQVSATGISVTRTAPPHPPQSTVSRSRQAPQDVQPGEAYLRFVGDLSPEASFLANRKLKNGDQDRSRYASRHESVGVWLGQKSDEASLQQDSGPSGPGQPERGSPHRGFMLPTLQSVLPSLRQECLSTISPSYEFGLLYNLYYAKIDPLFPILHGERMEQHNAMEAVALKQSICLVASLDPSMRRYLRLPHSDRVLSPIEFRATMAAAIKQSLDMRFIKDKIVLLQVCALMALYVDKPGCSDVSSYYCAQAVHLSQGLGLHLGWPDTSARGQKSRRLFWCVWVLDRFNAATNGRPVLSHSRDMDNRILDSLDTQMPAFRLLLRVTQFLDDTISQYRPNFPEVATISGRLAFEDLVRETGSLDIGNTLLASVEILYLAVVILRSRPKDVEGGSGTPSSELQCFCATSIVSIASDEFKDSVSFWPMLPYAVSMATSVAYKSLRNSTLPNNRKRAYGLFHSSCEILDDLSKSFLSARTVARLAMDTLQEVERVAAGRGRNNQPSEAQAAPLIEPASAQMITDSSAGDPPSSQIDCQFSPLPIQKKAPEPVLHDQTDTTLTTPNPLSFDLESFDNFAGEEGIFDDFDPSFDLSRIDAVFSATLDPTLPSFPDEWIDVFS